MDPEHLRDHEWREITESPTFRPTLFYLRVSINFLKDLTIRMLPSIEVEVIMKI